MVPQSEVKEGQMRKERGSKSVSHGTMSANL